MGDAPRLGARDALALHTGEARVREIPAACAAELRAYFAGVRATGEIVVTEGAGVRMIEDHLRQILGSYGIEGVRPFVAYDTARHRLRVEFGDGEGSMLVLRGAPA